MIGSESGDGIQILLDRIGIPIVPAEPAVVRWGVVHTKTVTRGVQPVGLSGRSGQHVWDELMRKRYRAGSRGTTREEIASVHFVVQSVIGKTNPESASRTESISNRTH